MKTEVHPLRKYRLLFQGNWYVRESKVQEIVGELLRHFDLGDNTLSIVKKETVEKARMLITRSKDQEA